MAAWAALLCLSGFQYDAAEGAMQFVPPVRGNPFRCFWSTGGGAWGVAKLDGGKRTAELEVLHGRLKLRTLRLPSRFGSVGKATCGGRRVKLSVVKDGKAALIQLSRAVTVGEGKTIKMG